MLDEGGRDEATGGAIIEDGGENRDGSEFEAELGGSDIFDGGVGDGGGGRAGVKFGLEDGGGIGG